MVARFQNGYAFKSKDFSIKGNYRIIKIKELKDGKIKFHDDSKFISINDISRYEKYLVNKNDILFALTGDPVNRNNPLSWVGRVSIYQHDIPALINQRVCKLIPGDNINAKYIYYYFRYFKNLYALASIAKGSASQANISTKDIENFDVVLPSLENQNKVIAILDSIEKKINNNISINNNLEQQAMATFKSWFIDYEPFDGDIPNNWIEYKLSDFLPVITGKKNANVASEKGEYPFFSCSKDITWTNEYSFDGNAILVAGNGDFNVKFYNGKFEAYQRTYVLIPNNSRFTAWLYYAVKYNLNKITSAARGSVIKFITKSNLEDYSFYAPSDLDNFFIIDYFQVINNEIAHNNVEKSKLVMLRNLILPKLLSGELDVSNIEI